MATMTTYPPRVSTKPSKRGKKSDCGCGCGCPSCKGLECLERPRYFAGQLLTEAELNSEQAYVIAKNRLHNRYLHGWGVVCGLEVVCSNCDGWVRVREGYAIDPCGNDIIVCRERDFNVVEAINKCLDAKHSRDEECPPWQDPNADCKDDEEQWCVTIRYDEVQTKATMPLRQEGTSSCESGCGCGGNAKKKPKASASKSPCGCGGGCGDAPSPPKSNARGVACEPTRILEGYQLEIVCQPVECRDAHRVVKSTDTLTSRGEPAVPARDVTSGIGPMSATMIRALVPNAVLENAWVRAGFRLEDENTLFARILDAFTEVETFLGERLSKADMAQLTEAFKAVVEREGKKTGIAPAELSFSGGSSTAEDFCCRFRRALRELYVDNPLGVRCTGFDCPPCARDPHQPNDPVPGVTVPPQEQNFDAIFCLVNALINYIIDAVCLKILPPCPPTPCDDRLILACVTVRNGKIVHICNFACRHYAGSFNSLLYWTSIVPVISIIASIVRKICCSPHALRAILRGDDSNDFNRVIDQPNG